jgi:protein-S-isoprenylcysteine O-methyltransferase Ste14
MKRKVPPITWTILCFLILALSATSYAKTADTLVIVLRLSLLLVFSALGVREWWRYQHRAQWSNSRSDAGASLLRRWRRWATDEPENDGDRKPRK